LTHNVNFKLIRKQFFEVSLNQNQMSQDIPRWMLLRNIAESL